MQCVVLLDGESPVAGRFQHDKHWKAGGKRRKAYAFYDPTGLYDALKGEEALRAEADAKWAERAHEAPA